MCIKERRNTTLEAASSGQVRLWPRQLLGMVTRQWLSCYIYMVQWPIHQGFTQFLFDLPMIHHDFHHFPMKSL